MRIIGIVGKSGAGKSTAAGMLAAVLNDIGFTVKIDSFNLPITKQIRTDEGGLDKRRDRRVMQHISSALREQNEDYFVQMLARRNGFASNLPVTATECSTDGDRRYAAPPADFLIIPGVRFPNEADFCRRHGVVILLEGSHEGLEGAEARHESETMAARMERSGVDHVVPKQASLTKLARAMEEIVEAGLHLREETDNA